jgi:hypothetical protein
MKSEIMLVFPERSHESKKFENRIISINSFLNSEKPSKRSEFLLLPSLRLGVDAEVGMRLAQERQRRDTAYAVADQTYQAEAQRAELAYRARLAQAQQKRQVVRAVADLVHQAEVREVSGEVSRSMGLIQRETHENWNPVEKDYFGKRTPYRF